MRRGGGWEGENFFQNASTIRPTERGGENWGEEEKKARMFIECWQTNFDSDRGVGNDRRRRGGKESRRRIPVRLSFSLGRLNEKDKNQKASWTATRTEN